jgi:hypothetical protein
MTVTPLPPSRIAITGVPDYYKVYQMWLGKFKETGDDNHRTLAYHYARVASEMGQVIIGEDNDTIEVTR